MAELTNPEELSKLKVAELKKALKDRGLPVTGSKSELVERLFADVTSVQDDSFFSAMILKEVKETEKVLVDAEAALKEEAPKKKEPIKKEIQAPKKTVTASVTAPKPKTAATDSAGSSSETESTTEKPPKVVALSGVSEAERLKKRAERFGVINEDLKKMTRAERFGLPVTGPSTKLSSTVPAADVEVLKKRAERFGQVVSTTLSKAEEEERIKKRKDRFGDVTAATNNKPSKFAKITYNSNPEVEEKKKKRAERFGLTS